MRIKKGEFWRCIRANKNTGFTVGSIYESDDDGCLVDGEGDSVYISDSKFERLYTIQDIRDGKVAVVNDGTPEEFLKVMRFAKSKVNFFTAIANIKYAVISQGCSYAINIIINDFPKQSVKDFLIQLPNEELKTPDLSDEALKGKSKEQKKEEFHEHYDLNSRSDFIPPGWVFGEVTACILNRIGKRDKSSREWQPKVGETIEAMGERSRKWRQCVYIGKSKITKNANVVFCYKDKRAYLASNIRPFIVKQKVSKQEIADHLGINIEQLEIID